MGLLIKISKIGEAIDFQVDAADALGDMIFTTTEGGVI